MKNALAVLALCSLASVSSANLQLNFPTTKLGTGPENVLGNVSADAMVMIDGVDQGRISASNIFQGGSPLTVSLVWAYDSAYEGPINDGSSVSIRDVKVYLTCPQGTPQLTYARGVNNAYSYFIGVPFPTNLPTAMPVFATLVCGQPPACGVSVSTLDFGITISPVPVQLSFQVCNIGGGVLTGTVTENCPTFSIVSGANYALAAGACQTVVVEFVYNHAGPTVCEILTGADCSPVVCVVNGPPECGFSFALIVEGSIVPEDCRDDVQFTQSGSPVSFVLDENGDYRFDYQDHYMGDNCPTLTFGPYVMTVGSHSQIIGESIVESGVPLEVHPLLQPFPSCTVVAEEVVAGFALAEAYPNPFNPSTTLRYSVPENQDVTLNVYNTSGQLVKTLVNGMALRGEHKVVFDASDLASGVYVYTLNSATQSAMHKMVLVK